MSNPPYDSPFIDAAPYYRFRAPYAQEAINYVCNEFRLDENARVLDLGCGPGTLSIPIARCVGEVIAVDPDVNMLAEGQRQAQLAGITNITWENSLAEEITPGPGTFDAAIMGQSFHWMERDLVLTRLSPMIRTGSGIALIGPSARRPQESWEPIASEIVSRYLGTPVRHPRANPDEPENEPALRRAVHFAKPTSRVFTVDIERDITSIIGCVYSMSNSRKSLFGERVNAFEQELADALLQVNPEGIFRETVDTEVIIARKLVSRS